MFAVSEPCVRWLCCLLACRSHPYNTDLKNCDIDPIWGVHGTKFVEARRRTKFPHFLLLEQPWFWREDPVDPRRMWTFVSWDYLNG